MLIYEKISISSLVITSVGGDRHWEKVEKDEEEKEMIGSIPCQFDRLIICISCNYAPKKELLSRVDNPRTNSYLSTP
jgi:hypothetical protein